MLLKAISALAAVVLLATTAIAVPHKSFTNSSKLPNKRIMAPRQSFDDGSRCNNPPHPGNIWSRGGRIMTGNVNIYLIFYGSWTPSQKEIVIDFSKSIGGSDYANIMRRYGASGQMTFAGSFDDNYSHSNTLKDTDIPRIVENAINNGLAYDTNGIYFVLPSRWVKEESFCHGVCAFHYYAPIRGTNITYSFVGNMDQCSVCNPCNPTVSPNGDTGIDGMINGIAHEMMEAISDPELTAWFDADNFENADKCVFNFGEIKTLPNGANFNVILGGKPYLIQQNWDANIQGCAMS